MTTLILNNQFKQFDLNGEPLAAGRVYTYEVGTTTEKVTYQDEAATVPHTNPIILDSFGEATIWISGDTKLVIQDSDGIDIRTYPSFSDTESTGEFPVVSSPQGAVFRSDATETGYIKIRLPMGEWPNTKMLFDVMIYTDDADEAFILTLGGYADSNTSSWLTTTAITNGETDYAVQFGNDGTYPAIYIGGVASSWTKPQIAVTNFLAGQFSYDWTTWDNGWEITTTTSLGTITSSKTAVSDKTEIDTNATNIATNTADISDLTWGAWQTPTYTASWSDYTSLGFKGLRFRKTNDGKNLQISGSITETGSLNSIVFTLPSDYRPTNETIIIAKTVIYGFTKIASISTAGVFEVLSYDTSRAYIFNEIIALDL